MKPGLGHTGWHFEGLQSMLFPKHQLQWVKSSRVSPGRAAPSIGKELLQKAKPWPFGTTQSKESWKRFSGINTEWKTEMKIEKLGCHFFLKKSMEVNMAFY